MSKNDEAALVPRTTRAVVKANPGVKGILSGMVVETLALAQAKASPQGKRIPANEGTGKSRETAQLLHAWSDYMTGMDYEFGLGDVSRNHAEAVKWYRKAAETGAVFAQHKLGTCYNNGRGIPKDDVEATTWYRKAAEQGNASSQHELGRCYANGEGVPQDYAQAAGWFRKAAEQGDADAQHELSACYYRGLGVSRDCAEAVRWYRSAAEQGHANAQCGLGHCYDHGEGVSQDHAEAVKWYRKAAEKGHLIAQDNLGLAYSIGSDVQDDQDIDTLTVRIATEKLAIFRSARERAEKGYADSQFFLGNLYLDLANSGVPGTGSLNHACAWLRLAAEQGHSEAKEQLASLVSLLSPSELAESERLYEQYSKPKSSPI